MRYSTTCPKCKKIFNEASNGEPYSSQGAAEQALRMHVARIHTKTIKTPTGPMNPASVARRQNLIAIGKANGNPGNIVESFAAPRHHHGSKLSAEQTAGVLNFIRTRRSEFSNKTTCFLAALEANKATGLIKANSTAVFRYFEKAGQLPSPAAASAAPAKRAKVKRNYTKMAKHPRHEDSEDSEHGYNTMHWCPQCGLDLQALATGMTVAAATSRRNYK